MLSTQAGSPEWKRKAFTSAFVQQHCEKTILEQMDPRKTTVTVSTGFLYCQFIARQSGGSFQKIAIWNAVPKVCDFRPLKQCCHVIQWPKTTEVYGFMLKLLLCKKRINNLMFCPALLPVAALRRMESDPIVFATVARIIPLGNLIRLHLKGPEVLYLNNPIFNEPIVIPVVLI